MHSILAVDDSPSMRQMVSFTLKNAGFAVVEAVDGQDAWEKASARDFNLVLTDQNMPRMDGLTLVKKLREAPKFKNTPILVLTADPRNQAPELTHRALAVGEVALALGEDPHVPAQARPALCHTSCSGGDRRRWNPCPVPSTTSRRTMSCQHLSRRSPRSSSG